MLQYRLREYWLEMTLGAIAVAAYGLLVFLVFVGLPQKTPEVITQPVDTTIKSLILNPEENAKLEGLLQIPPGDYSEDLVPQMRFEIAYNYLVENKLQSVMSEILISEDTVKSTVAAGAYDKLTQKIKLETSGVVKVFDSQEQFKGKVGETFRGEKVIEVLTITAEDQLDDARGYLVSLQALREIEKVADSYREGAR